MSLVQLTLRPPPHVDFVSGYPGIPPNGTDRPQAAVKGAIEVRVPFQGVKAQYVKVELRKVETLPGGGTGNTFYDLVGPGTVTLWTSGGAEYELLHAQDFPFSIRIPESVPPTLQLDQRAGVHYELVATVCTKGKRGFFRRRKNTITTTSSGVIIDKHDLHSTWPVYCQQEKRHVIKDGVKLTVERNQSCYGPGDRMSVTASIWSDNAHTIMLRSFEILLRETISFRGHMFVAGKKGEPLTRANTISENVYQVNTPMYRGMQTTQDLFCILPGMHTNTTLTAARHIDINYVLVVRALMGTGSPLIVELPVIVSNWQKSVSVEAMRRIGPAPGLSRLPTPGPGAVDSQVITRVDPIQTRSPSSDALNRPPTAEVPGHNRPNAYNTHPMTSTTAAAKVDDPFATSSRRPTHQPSGSQGSAKSGTGADEFGNWTRPAAAKSGGAGKRPPSAGSILQTPRFTITNALPLEIPEDSQASQPLRNGLGPNKGQWLSATEEKQMLYEQAKRRVEMVQGSVTQPTASPVLPPAGSQVTTPPPQVKSQTRNGPWRTAEEEKFHSAQAAVARTHGYGTVPDSVQLSSTSKPPSAAAAMYSQAMSARIDPAKQAPLPPIIPKATLPSSPKTKIPGYLTAQEEKEALRRYEDAKRAVDRVQNFQDTPGGSGSGLISYDSLYPSSPSGSAAQAMGPPPPFDAGPPSASLSRQTSATVTPSRQGATPPPFSGGVAYPSAAAEKETIRRRFEAQDAVSNALPNAFRSRPTPLPPPTAVDGNGQRVLTAAEEKALLKARYEAQDDHDGEATLPPMYVNGGGYPSGGLPSAGSSSGASYSALSYVSSMGMTTSPPPLMPRPPQEYIKETQEEDARLVRMTSVNVNGVSSSVSSPDEERTEVGHGNTTAVPSRKPTASPATFFPFDKPPLPPKPLDD